ncbi:hypothetical protein RIF25_06445 [Thermosynechococcaceae cyanobacterium BACA0444]|uniref:Uncharacterized protein n=1 Tax=Pseudocalidococcus azoricus BACA0444 TaxID=2918990 RepID=A0AAE4FQS0_9CYAN|nr:hypothetical protein [Pseudocalidococcus azoricus]MDS3860446.1 hypothetical protein [Pseudocalidococcus azoricus BACA0444]
MPTPQSVSNIQSTKELFDYWYHKVIFRNHDLIESDNHLPAYEIRHECTNYDTLLKLPEVETLTGLERDRVYAIIKYQCTSKVLQRRASYFRQKSVEIRHELDQLNHQNQENKNWIEQLRRLLFSKDIEIKQLTAQIALLEAEKEVLQAESDQSSAYAELLKEVETLRKKFEKEKKRREELGKNNQSLGGRVAHTERYKRERNEAREQVTKLEQINRTLQNELNQLKGVPLRSEPNKSQRRLKKSPLATSELERDNPANGQ